MSRAAPFWKKFSHFWQHEVWRLEHLGDRSPRGLFFSVLRVLSITLSGLRETRVASRAAALSFSSLLGLGPLVAIVMLVAGFVLNNQDDPGLAARKLDGLLHRFLPQLAEYDRQHAVPPPPAPATLPDRAPDKTPTVAPVAGPATAATDTTTGSEMTKLINSFIAGSRSGTVGIVGALTLIVIVLQLFTSVENAFNEIWGVRRGRSLLLRVVFYWTVLTLGGVLFFAAVAGLSASALINAVAAWLPHDSALAATAVGLARNLLPSFSVVLLAGLLTLFYRFIPNTKVWWRAAIIGAVVVTGLLVLNHYLAFLYVRRVALQSSLYGSLGLLPVLMAGLYIFWLFILVGGQLSYAVQNVHFRNSQAVWGGLAGSVRTRLSLLVLLTIARRFQACLEPCNALQLGDMLKVPTQILNECLNRLVRMQLIMPVPPSADEGAADFRYQPARPLSRITLGEFKRLDDDFGEAAATPMIASLDPLVQHYDESLTRAATADVFTKPLDVLLTEHAADTSRPPFAFGKRIKQEE